MIGLRLKSTVRLRSLSSQIVLALQIVLPVYETCGAPELWVTSCNDGMHKPGSLHYTGQACDLRVHNVVKDRRRLLFSMLSSRLETASGYLVLWEGQGTPNEHIHIQWKG